MCALFVLSTSSQSSFFSLCVFWYLFGFARFVCKGDSDEQANFDENIKIQTHKRFKRTLFIRTRQNQLIFGEIPFVKLQNDTLTTAKRSKTTKI